MVNEILSLESQKTKNINVIWFKLKRHFVTLMVQLLFFSCHNFKTALFINKHTHTQKLSMCQFLEANFCFMHPQEP